MVTVLVVGGGAALRLAWRWIEWVRAGRPAVPQVVGTAEWKVKWRRRSILGWSLFWAMQVLAAALDARDGLGGPNAFVGNVIAWFVIAAMGTSGSVWLVSYAAREAGDAATPGADLDDGHHARDRPRSEPPPRR